ncbi:hypothetical protein EI94DRAFT_1703441 [Lactarius quietus]|nr:hypothetical protein EI94DRAFT_1703441 [Lactarius quietus]
MSSSTPETSNPPPDFKSILDTALSQALGDYKKKTGKDLLEHPLANKVQRCDSVDAIKAIFQGQAEAFQQFKDGDQRLMKWINPVVDVLFTFSKTAGGVAGTTIPHAKAIFTGISVLLGVRGKRCENEPQSARRTLRENRGLLQSPWGLYSGFADGRYGEVFVKIVAEVLSILSIATKEMKRKRSKIYLRKLLGRKDIEDALKRLDNLIQEEVRMATAETMKATIEHKDDSKKVNVAMASNMDEIKEPDRAGRSKMVLSA